jgi:hypothetical protein
VGNGHIQFIGKVPFIFVQKRCKYGQNNKLLTALYLNGEVCAKFSTKTLLIRVR